MAGDSGLSVDSRTTGLSPADVVGAWELNESASSVHFDVKKFWGLVTVHGTFTDLDGSAELGTGGSVSAELIIGTASVDSGQKKRDEHLRTADFFNVEEHPHLTVRVDRVDLLDASSGTAHGAATVVGVTRPLTFDVSATIDRTTGFVTLSGSTTIDRSEFGIDWSPLRMAAMDVVVSFELEFRPVRTEGE